MATVFVSCASHDQSFALKLKQALLTLGHAAWSFDEGISLGERWQNTIIEKLKDADAVVVLVSKQSVNSAWVQQELGAALAYSRERGTPIIVPVVLDLNPSDLPLPLAQFQAIVARDGDADEVALKLASALERQTGIRKAQEEKRKEAHKLVESSAAVFINKSLDELRERENTYRRLAYGWYGLAYFTLLVSVCFGVWRTLVLGPTVKEWPALVELTVSGVIVLALLVALAKYAFTLGKSFMVEALRNADRRHAISFGEFYLRAYGDTAEWKEVKEAFQHWNIDKGSHFIGQQTSEFDPQLISQAIEFAKAIELPPKFRLPWVT